jgi:hypothetical protein
MKRVRLLVTLAGLLAVANVVFAAKAYADPPKYWLCAFTENGPICEMNTGGGWPTCGDALNHCF